VSAVGKGLMMFPEKPKRKSRKHFSKYLLLLVLIPVLMSFHFKLELGLLGDSLAVTVLLCAAIYLVYQFVDWLIHWL
jgi:hypothetical protein